MEHLARWLRGWVPEWARRQLEEENRRLRQKIDRLQRENDRLNTYLDGPGGQRGEILLGDLVPLVLCLVKLIIQVHCSRSLPDQAVWQLA